MDLAAVFPQDENESEVLRWVTYDPVHIDEIIRSSGPRDIDGEQRSRYDGAQIVGQAGGRNELHTAEGDVRRVSDSVRIDGKETW